MDRNYPEKHCDDGSWLCRRCHRVEKAWRGEEFNYDEEDPTDEVSLASCLLISNDLIYLQVGKAYTGGAGGGRKRKEALTLLYRDSCQMFSSTTGNT